MPKNITVSTAEALNTAPEQQTRQFVHPVYPKGETVLKLTNLTKRYSERVSVDDVSLEVVSGEVFGFLGPNGAGKTTTIRMIAGISKITSGEAHVCGYSVRTEFKKAVQNIGGIIENPEMYKYMSGWDNLKYYASLYGGISDEQIMNVVKLVKMENRIHEKVKRYSLGMRQRVGIAQSLLHSPRLLILDEPTNGLDPAGIHEMRDFLKMLAHEFGIAVFISSHILTEMQLMCDRVAIISKGKMMAVKTVNEWTRPENNIIAIKIAVPPLLKVSATEIIESKLNTKVDSNGGLLIFSASADSLDKISILLSKAKIPLLSLSVGEKTLEETFLELTSTGGTNIS